MTLSKKISSPPALKSSWSVTVTFSALKIIMDYARRGDILSDFSQHYFELVNPIGLFSVVARGGHIF